LLEVVYNEPKGEERMADTTQKTDQQTLKIQQVDIPDLSETFADSIDSVFFDGQTLRINFGVTRFEQSQQSPATTALRYPSCRLVLTPRAGVELMNQIQKLMTGMIQAGVLKAAPQGATEKSKGAVVQ
jgi:hypothetical protein